MANPLSVRLELQADCLAGVWANSTAQRDLIEQKDVEAGIRAAGAVGDDRVQRMARGRVSPESFTHGSSAQRAEWFQRGLLGGDVAEVQHLWEVMPVPPGAYHPAPAETHVKGDDVGSPLF